MVVRARQGGPRPAYQHHQLLMWFTLFAVLNLGVHAFVLPSVSPPAVSRRRARVTASHLPAYRDSFSQGDRGGSRSSSSSSSGGDGPHEDESPKKKKLAKATTTTSSSSSSSSSRSSSDPVSLFGKESDAWESSILRTPPSSALKPHHRHGADAAVTGSSSYTFSSSPSRMSAPPAQPSAGASPSLANAGSGQRQTSPTTGWLDPLSLSPASLAAAIHGLVKEITTPPGGSGPGPAEAAAKAVYQKKAWERQRYMERELSALLAVAERNLPSLTPEAVSTIINAMSKLHPRALRNVVPLSSSYRLSGKQQQQQQQQQGGVRGSHVAGVFAVMTTEEQQQQQLSTTPTAAFIPSLLARALEVVNYMSPRCIATTVNSLARLVSSVAPFVLPLPPQLLSGLTAQAQRLFLVQQERRGGEMDGGPASSSSSSSSSRRYQAKEGFTPQGLANIINGYARLGFHPGRKFLELFCEEQLTMVEDVGPQTLANTMNALGKLGFHPGTLFLERMAARAHEILPHFNTQGLSNLLNGFARLSPPFHPGPAFLEALKDASLPCLHAFESRGLAALAHGFSTLGHHPGSDYLDALGEAMARRLERATQGREGMTGWTLSTLYNGLARLDWHPGMGLLGGKWKETTGWDESSPATTAAAPAAAASAAAAAAAGGGGGRSASSLADSARASSNLSDMDWRTPSSSLSSSFSSSSNGRGREGGREGQMPTGMRLWQATASWLVAQGQDEMMWGDVLEPQQLTQLLWSLAAMGPPVEAEDLFRRLLGAAIARLGSSSSSSSTESLSASSSSWKGAGREVDCQDGDCNPIPVHAIRQLRQVARFVCVVLGWEGVQAAVGGSVEADMLAEPEQATSSSLLHMEVLRLLCRDLAAHDARTEVDDGVYVQDIVLMPKSSGSSCDPSFSALLPVIVEVDGPPHFFNNMPRCSRGDHKLKNRILQAQTGRTNGGIVSVTWWEWVSRTRAQRTRMMVRKMVEIGVLDPSLYLGGVGSLSLEEDVEEEEQDYEDSIIFDDDDQEEEEEEEEGWLSDENEGDQDEARGPSGSGLIQAKTLSLLQRKQQKPQSMITWGKEGGGHLSLSPTSLSSSTPRIESEEESYLWSLTVLQLKDRLREKAMPVSGVKAALVARLIEAPEMETEGKGDAPR